MQEKNIGELHDQLIVELKKCPFFAFFEDAEIRQILAFATLVKYEFGQFVVREGEAADAFFFVYSGRVKVMKRTADKETALGALQGGDHFGEKCLVEDAPRFASVIASEESVLLRFPREQFSGFINERPQIKDYIHHYLQDIALINLIRLTTGFGRKVPLRQLKLLLSKLKRETYAQGEVLFREGDPGDKFYIISQGICEVLKLNEAGEEKSITKLEKGKFFGERALIQDEPRAAAIRAFTDCSVLTLAKDDFFSLFRSAPAVAKIFEEKLIQYQLHNSRVLQAKRTKIDDEIAKDAVDVDELVRDFVQQPKRPDAAVPEGAFRRGETRIRRFPVIYQHTVTDCGAACLAMICKYHGKRVNLSYLRDIANITHDGASMLSLSEAAEKTGFYTKGVRLDLNGLKEAALPAVCHWGGYHWVVVYGDADGRIHVADPALGRKTYPPEEFSRNWSGMTLLLARSPAFTTASVGESTFDRLRPLLKAHRRSIALIFLVTFILSLLGLAAPFFTQKIIDDVLARRDKSLLQLMLGGMIVLFLFQTGFSVLKSFFTFKAAAAINLELFTGFFRHLCALPLKFFKNRRAGSIAALFAENTKIQAFLTGNFVNLFTDMFGVTIFIAVMFVYSRVLTLIFLCFIALLAGVTAAVTPHLKRMGNDVFHAGAEQNSQLIETLHGIDTVKAMALEDRRRREWEARYRRQLQFSYRQFKWESVLKTAISSISFGAATTLLYAGALQVMAGKMSVGQLMAFNGLTGAVMAPVAALIGFWDKIQEIKVSLERLEDVYNSAPEADAASGAIRLEEMNGVVEFENVFFRYGAGDAPYIIRNFNLTVYPGQKVAVVGRSGSGKTTLVKMIPKLLRPTDGRIRIDGIDIARLDRDFLRQKVGVILQESFIFSGTIYDNIRMGREEASEKMVLEAARLANAHEFIRKFPLGYRTAVGENGISLSGGQKQRICIARQLVGDPGILVLDEATSALDIETEKEIQSNLKPLLAGRTCFIISHRLHAVRDADVIVVLDEGVVVEQGRHEDLMKRQGLYYYLNIARMEME